MKPGKSKFERKARDPLTWWILAVGVVNLLAHAPAALDSIGRIV